MSGYGDAELYDGLGSNDTYSHDKPFLSHILRFLENHEHANNSNLDFRQPYIKSSLRYVYPLFILLHAIICVGGICGNVAMLVVIIRRRLYKNPTFFFLGNLALSDILKAAVVLPITVTTMLISNWIFGSFLCFFLPMMHSFPVHASMLTYMVIAVDRYRLIVHPMKSRVPTGLCVIAVWVAGVCVVLPYAVYIRYSDLGVLGEQFDGVGLCWISMSKNIQEYIRAMFVILYCLPLATMNFLYVRVSAELKSAESPSVSIHFEENIRSASDATYQTNITWSPSESGEHTIGQECNSCEDNGHTSAYRSHSRRRHSDPDEEDNQEADIDIRKEKRTQKYMITMVMVFAMCWCPINILTLVNHFVLENDDNAGHFDVTYLTFTFFGFMSTCTNPILFASWSMSDQTRDRLKGYFRFSNRRQSGTLSTHSTVSHHMLSPNSSSHLSVSPHNEHSSVHKSLSLPPHSNRGHVQFFNKRLV